jgi:hypothetical protein
MKIVQPNGDVYDANEAGSVPNRGLLLELGNPPEVARLQANHLINFRQDGSTWLYINDGENRIENIFEIWKLNKLMLDHYSVSLEEAINAQPYNDAIVSFDFILYTMTLTVKTKFPDDVGGLPIALYGAKKLGIDVLDRHVMPNEQYSVTIDVATTLPAKLALFLQPLTYHGGGCSDYFRQVISDFKQE